MPTVSLIEIQEVAQRILDKRMTDTSIVDVRQEDFEGGNIKTAIHVPHPMNKEKLHAIAQRIINMQHKEVIFHCYFCKMRGPTAAKKFSKFMKETHPNYDVKVWVLKRGWSAWKNTYKSNDQLVENMKYVPHISPVTHDEEVSLSDED